MEESKGVAAESCLSLVRVFPFSPCEASGLGRGVGFGMVIVTVVVGRQVVRVVLLKAMVMVELIATVSIDMDVGEVIGVVWKLAVELRGSLVVLSSGAGGGMSIKASPMLPISRAKL